ncbi:MAG: hypothetical protein K5770_20165 [Lachnospiraceae bacterium]|nr:hypothetical protein [Lachnospiraceae bacterium]
MRVKRVNAVGTKVVSKITGIRYEIISYDGSVALAQELKGDELVEDGKVVEINETNDIAYRALRFVPDKVMYEASVDEDGIFTVSGDTVETGSLHLTEVIRCVPGAVILLEEGDTEKKIVVYEPKREKFFTVIELPKRAVVTRSEDVSEDVTLLTVRVMDERDVLDDDGKKTGVEEYISGAMLMSVTKNYINMIASTYDWGHCDELEYEEDEDEKATFEAKSDKLTRDIILIEGVTVDSLNAVGYFATKVVGDEKTAFYAAVNKTDAWTASLRWNVFTDGEKLLSAGYSEYEKALSVITDKRVYILGIASIFTPDAAKLNEANVFIDKTVENDTTTYYMSDPTATVIKTIKVVSTPDRGEIVSIA